MTDLTLRDRFAMSALTGLLFDTWEENRQYAPMALQGAAILASTAYALADAMLLARETTTKAEG